MKKIIYNGDISPCRISVSKVIFDNWSTGEIREMEDEIAEKILVNKNFSEVKEIIHEREEIKMENNKKIKTTRGGHSD